MSMMIETKLMHHHLILLTGIRLIAHFTTIIRSSIHFQRRNVTGFSTHRCGTHGTIVFAVAPRKGGCTFFLLVLVVEVVIHVAFVIIVVAGIVVFAADALALIHGT